MKRKIRFYRQHSPETCGISCILMLLHVHGRVRYPTEKQERKLYSLYRCRAFMGTLPGAMAECLMKNGLAVEMYHTSGRSLANLNGYYPEELYREILRENEQALDRIRHCVRIFTHWVFTPEWYREMLAAHDLAVQCAVPGDADGMHDRVLHWILLDGYADGFFRAFDPMQGRICLTEAELMGYADTPVGMICLAVENHLTGSREEGTDEMGKENCDVTCGL